MREQLNLFTAVSWGPITPLHTPEIVLLCLLVSAIGTTFLLRLTVIDNSEAPIFALVRYVGRTALWNAKRKLLRLTSIR